VPPLALEFCTVIDADPAVAISAAGTVARSIELDTWVVVRAVPFHLITALGANDSPSAVRVKSLPPTVMMLGNTELSVSGGTGATVKFTTFEIGATGFEYAWTETGVVPMLAIWDALIDAVSWLGNTSVVGTGVPPQSTTEAIVKFVPLTVSVKSGDPTIAEFGARVVTVGSGPGSNT
jgi:hypothetical protein